MRALGRPELGEAGVFVLRELVFDQAEILDGAGEDELVDEQDDGFGGEFGLHPFDLVEFVIPNLQVLEKLLLQFGAFRRVFHAAQSVEHAAGRAGAREEIGEGQCGERLFVEEEITRTIKPHGAEVGEDEVFVVAEIFFDLRDVVFGIGILAVNRIRAVTQEERFQFQRQRVAHAFRQHEIHETFHDPDLARGLKTEDILAKRGEHIFGGGFGLGAVLQVEQIFFNWSVSGGLAHARRERKEIHALKRGEFTQGVEDFGVIHF